MRGNSFGKLFSLTSFGESHGEYMGVVMDGLPAGLEPKLEDLQSFLKRRSPGQEGSSARQERDRAQIVSGVFEGKTLGTPLCVLIKNEDHRSSDYSALRDVHRPGHADKTTEMKYGIRDYRGGGRSSGRETISRVIAGYFASLVLPQLDVHLKCLQLGHLVSSDEQEQKKYLQQLQQEGDSCGVHIEFRIKNVPPALGEPCFDKLKADLAKAFLSIGGCVAFSYGLGERAPDLLGKEMIKDDNNWGGIEGGISSGEDIFGTLTFKAPASVGNISKQGRHDPCLYPRVIPVIESMAKIVLVDHYLRQKAYL